MINAGLPRARGAPLAWTAQSCPSRRSASLVELHPAAWRAHACHWGLEGLDFSLNRQYKNLECSICSGPVAVHPMIKVRPPGSSTPPTSSFFSRETKPQAPRAKSSCVCLGTQRHRMRVPRRAQPIRECAFRNEREPIPCLPYVFTPPGPTVVCHAEPKSRTNTSGTEHRGPPSVLNGACSMARMATVGIEHIERQLIHGSRHFCDVGVVLFLVHIGGSPHEDAELSKAGSNESYS